MKKKFLSVPIDYEVFQLLGGLDQVTPTLSLKPAVARDAQNWEVSVTGGYSRVTGYERTDGRAGAPSAATYSGISLNATTGITVGSTISNGLGATGTVIAINGLDVFYTQQVSSITLGNTISGNTVTAVGVGVTPSVNAAYLLLAANVYRTLITAVPGAGDTRGVAWFEGVLYAWRNNAGNTALVMHKATSGGWVAITFGYEVAFTTGSVSPTIGGTITKGAVSAVVRAIVVESGTFGGGTAAGRFITDAPTGGAFTAGALSAGGTATLAANLTGGLVQAQIAFLPNGHVQTYASNFGGASVNKLYGCDNINRGWEFDGTTMVPLKTGMAIDVPENVIVHELCLFFSFKNSLQFSAIGNPYSWAPILGAGEIVMPERITALVQLPGDQSTGALGVYSAKYLSMLYGKVFSGSSADAKLSSFPQGFGAAKYSVINLDQTYGLAQRGVVSLNTSLNYGNFDANTLTMNIRPYIQSRRGQSVVGGLNRERSQYRLFYQDGSGLYVTMGKNSDGTARVLGSMPVTFPNPVTCWCEGDTNATNEAAYFGSTDGYVRKLDTGNTFDGASVEHRFTLNFDSVRNPRILKRFRKAALEISGNSYNAFNVGYTLAYADPAIKDQPLDVTYESQLSQIAWDAGFFWDTGLFWDGRTLGPTEVELDGSGENIALAVRGNSAAYGPFTINTITIHYTPRRGLR